MTTKRRVEKSPEGEPAQGPMRRVLGNFTLLLRGRGIAAIMLLATTALMARALGPAEFGMVVVMQTYVLLIRGLLNFKQFQAIIRYGVPAYDADDTRTLRRLIGISRRLDLHTSVIATVVAVGVAPLIGPLMGLDRDQVFLLMAYSLVLLTSRNVTGIGILRLLDKFDILGRKETIGPSIRLVGVALARWLEGPVAV
jgi:O-antigen/teichoic acid export membrane protein